MWVGLSQSVGGLNRKRQRKGEFIFSAGLLSWNISLLLPLVRTQAQTGAHIIIFPGSPTCQLQTVGLLSLHNHVGQLLIRNHTYPIGYASLDNPDYYTLHVFSTAPKTQAYCCWLIGLSRTKKGQAQLCRAATAGLQSALCGPLPVGHCLLLVCSEIRTGMRDSTGIL